MTDCPNADVRDLLPDFLHDRLVPAEAERVRAHLATCDDCRAELALLRDVRAVMGRAPAVDVAGIVAAIPPYRPAAKRSWVGWRVAASITVLLAGGSSLLVMQNAPARPDSVQPAVVRPSDPVPAAAASPAPTVGGVVVTPPASVRETAVAHPTPVQRAPAGEQRTATSPAQTKPARELAMGGGALGDLSDRELASLLKDIESMDGVPSAEVETPAMSPIAPRSGRRGTP